jgi:rubrerythrin
MGAGRRAARAMATWLQQGKAKWPVTREDVESFQPPTPITAEVSHAHAGASVPSGAMETPQHTCPKCHRPIEGDEEYICCGTSQLSWKCGDCGKVSEGFAFPYGLCPACGGGKLAALDPRQLDTAAALQAIRVAFEIELGGMAFYTRASKETSDPVLRELFGKFAEMEKEHMATLSRRYHAEVPAPSPDFKIDRAAVYAGIENRPEDPANLFRIAIAFEQRAVKLFEERAAKASGVEKQLFQELAAEEREHVALLTTELEQWKKGKAGIL